MDLVALNSGVVDWWTIIHFLSGMLIAWAFIREPTARILIWTIAVLVIWEILEVSNPGGMGGSETGINLLADLVAGMAGFVLGRYAGSLDG